MWMQFFALSIVLSIPFNRSHRINSIQPVCFSSTEFNLLQFLHIILSILSGVHLICLKLSLFFPALPPFFFSDSIFIQEFSFHCASAVCSFLSYPVIHCEDSQEIRVIFVHSCHPYRWIQFSYPWSSYPFQPLNSFRRWKFFQPILFINSSLFLSGVLKIFQEFWFSNLQLFRGANLI